ncbi:MAG TPA: F0F1 ATP synthase subunit A [Methylomirabilota bacterium]|nr:F0F1 ATP synthase subunit A [Methylomirabilota bacterium]
MFLLKRLLLLLALAGMPLLGFAADAPAADVVPNPVDTSHAAADGHHEGEHHGLPAYAPVVFQIGKFAITNSMIATWVAAAILIIFAQLATRNIKAVPTGLQNFWEMMVEGLYGLLEELLGSKLVRSAFWFFATCFIFITFANWMGLFPGVGTIGWNVTENGVTEFRPFLRGANADLNMTSAMALVFFFMWFVWSLKAIGVGGMAKHIFGGGGDEKGFMKLFLMAIFMAVGVIEVVSILFRPVSLSFRLFGNVFAGENILESMTGLIPWVGSLLAIPFYFLELLVGVVQAFVFTLLTAVFTSLMATHDEHHGEEAHH